MKVQHHYILWMKQCLIIMECVTLCLILVEATQHFVDFCPSVYITTEDLGSIPSAEVCLFNQRLNFSLIHSYYLFNSKRLKQGRFARYLVCSIILAFFILCVVCIIIGNHFLYARRTFFKFISKSCLQWILEGKHDLLSLKSRGETRYSELLVSDPFSEPHGAMFFP